VARALHSLADIMLKRNLPVFLLAAATAAGCAAQPVGEPGDDNGDDVGGGGDGGGDDVPPPSTPEGTFAITSDFDLASNAPGTAGKVANYFIAATDDPDDPTKFLVDELIKALPDGSIKDFAQQSAPFVTGYLNDRLLEIAPNFVTKIIDVGDAFGQVTRHFGTVETLQVDAQGRAVTTVRGLHFKIDNVDMNFAFADYGIAETKVEGLTVTLEPSGKLQISEHTVPLKYGQVLKLALDQAVIPMIDPSAQDLGDILESAVDCEAVGQYVFEALDFGSPSTYETACHAGLQAASGALYKLMDQIDGSALEFGLAGTARGVDRNADGKMDDLQSGTWSGTLGYAGQPAPLANATFFGKRAP
jgi:hypothetical protein